LRQMHTYSLSRRALDLLNEILHLGNGHIQLCGKASAIGPKHHVFGGRKRRLTMREVGGAKRTPRTASYPFRARASFITLQDMMGRDDIVGHATVAVHRDNVYHHNQNAHVTQ
jgi:hypothetical protein